LSDFLGTETLVLGTETLADKKPQQEFPIAVPMRTPICHPSVTAADTQQASSCHPSVTAKEVSTSKGESNGPPREAWKVEKELKAVREEIARTRDDPPSATRKELLRGLNKREAKLRQEFAAAHSLDDLSASLACSRK
jgi:hypothetical protein